jgi:hypothetical protein
MLTEIKITWSIEDVQSVREDLTDEQCSEVLELLQDNHDASIGINWEVIEATCQELFPEDE